MTIDPGNVQSVEKLCRRWHEWQRERYRKTPAAAMAPTMIPLIEAELAHCGAAICGECGGDGEVEYDDFVSGINCDGVVAVRRTCHDCEGKGYVELSPQGEVE